METSQYHLACLTGLRNRQRSYLRQSLSSQSNLEESQIEARAFVVTHIEDAVADGTFCFKFSSLCQMFESCLGDLGISKEVNKVQFKERVL